MDSNDDSTTSDTSTESREIHIVATAATLLLMLKDQATRPAPVVQPCPLPPKLTGAQWMTLNLHNPGRCHDNLRMSPEDFMCLHDMVLPYGLPGSRECSTVEVLGLFIWTCAQGASVRQAKDRFEHSIDTISRKLSQMSRIMYEWPHTMIGPVDSQYAGVSMELKPYAPWFDGCIGAIDGTHVTVEVNREVKIDYINRKGEVSLNVCAIVDMHGRFTYVGAGKAGACHDMHVLRDCEKEDNFPHPPEGRYYLADSGYMLRKGYMTPYSRTRYHQTEFIGVPHAELSPEERFNYIHSKLRNVIERRFGTLKERWQILKDTIPFMKRHKQSWFIISCFALENFVWQRHFGYGSTYAPDPFVYLNASCNMEELRNWTCACC